MGDVNSFKMRDWCLVWGLPLFVFLAISLLVSLMLGANFGNDNFVRGVIFLSCVFFLCIVYYLFQSFWVELFSMIWNWCCRFKSSDSQIMPKENQSLTGRVIEKDFLQSKECQQDGENNVLSDSPVGVQPSDDAKKQTDLYTLYNKEYQQEQELHRQMVIATIIEYSQITMAPFVSDKGEMQKLLDEIKKWADKYTYTPVPIKLKQKLTTLDLRHFVWNIGERLGAKNGYSGHVRADFIKVMFPDIMKDCEHDSTRNFRKDPTKGNIKLDPPDENDYSFHYDK